MAMIDASICDQPTSDEQIIGELMQFQRQNPRLDLLQFENLARANQYRRLYRLVRQQVPAGKTVLDWGCGNGHFSYFLLRAGYQASGFAFHPIALQRELGSLGFSFAQGSSREVVKLPYADGQFDAVVSVGVLEHVREVGGNELGSLQEIRRILKPGGLFLCYHLPNAYSLIEQIASQLPKMHHHAYRYTQRDVAALCQQVDLTLQTIERYGFLPRNIWSKLPKPLSDSPWLLKGLEPLDQGMGKLFSGICQNYLFVAQKPQKIL